MSVVAAHDVAAAERRAERIRLRLDAIADNIDAVLPMIREAIEREDHRTLGYNGVSDYVQDRFGGALTRLPRDLRRPVVHELAAAGMSTRAIAPVVGTSHMAVARDLAAPVTTVTPAIDTETGEVSDDYEDDDEPSPGLVRLVQQNQPAEPQRRAVVGIDGKNYTRPESRKPQRRSLVDDARDAGQELRKVTDRLARIAADDRLSRNRDEVAAHLRHHLDQALKVCRDLSESINHTGV